MDEQKDPRRRWGCSPVLVMVGHPSRLYVAVFLMGQGDGTG